MGIITKINAGGTDHLIASSAYGTCTTAANTAAKVVTLSNFDTLTAGVTIHVRFTYSNTVASPTLNVNSKGAKPIYAYGTTTPGTTVGTSWQAGAVVSFTYNTDNNSSGCWVMNNYIADTDTDNDTKVTSSANHYTPSTASGNDKTASASGATAAWSIDVVKGITINTDGKGHITGLSVTSGKIPANPNTDTKVKLTSKSDSAAYIVTLGPSSITSGTAYEGYYSTNLTYNPSTKELSNGTIKLKTDSTSGSGVSAYDTLTLGNNVNVGSTSAHSQGKIILYGGTAYSHTIIGNGPDTENKTIWLPNESGTILLGTLGYTTSGNNRAVLKDSSGNLYVTQKDDNTTYSAGTGLSLSGTTFSVKTGYTTSGNNRKVQADSSGNLYVVQTDTNTYVTQTANTTNTWRKVLGTYNGNSSAAGSITSGSSNVAYYDADGPAFNTSNGYLYAPDMYMYIDDTSAFYTNLTALDWAIDVVTSTL